MNVYIGEPVEVSDMQGPAPDGFHVPLSSEWQAIYDAYTGLGLSGGTNFSTYLKMPMAGNRRNSDLDFRNRGSYGFYWSSTSNGAEYADDLRFYSSNVNPQDSRYRTLGFSVRCLQNFPTIPTSSWTKLYGTSIESGGIFWSNTDGLISISSDGTTWYTLMDKNLGATTVYNYGDALTEANSGKIYQRGNNYGFSGDVNYDVSQISQSSTQVNVTGYGPGNYYESSTWITTNPRQSSANNGNNLRGGVSQGTSTVSQELQNAYIGEYVPPYEGDELCFTANTANSTVQLTKTGSPTSVTLETSRNGKTWSIYTIGDTITLSNVGDKVYWRNTSTTDTGFSIDTSNYYKFVMTGSIAASGDINYLLNKNSTATVGSYYFFELFLNNTGLTSIPKLTATTLGDGCYYQMFYNCSSLTTLPKLSALTLPYACYYQMFRGCSNIRISTTQTGAYQTAYRIPSEGNGTAGNYSLSGTFYNTGGTFTNNPSINTTYYTSNTVV